MEHNGKAYPNDLDREVFSEEKIRFCRSVEGEQVRTALKSVTNRNTRKLSVNPCDHKIRVSSAAYKKRLQIRPVE